MTEVVHNQQDDLNNCGTRVKLRSSTDKLPALMVVRVPTRSAASVPDARGAWVVRLVCRVVDGNDRALPSRVVPWREATLRGCRDVLPSGKDRD
jgi:hypothetical protein